MCCMAWAEIRWQQCRWKPWSSSMYWCSLANGAQTDHGLDGRKFDTEMILIPLSKNGDLHEAYKKWRGRIGWSVCWCTAIMSFTYKHFQWEWKWGLNMLFEFNLNQIHLALIISSCFTILDGTFLFDQTHGYWDICIYITTNFLISMTYDLMFFIFKKEVKNLLCGKITLIIESHR